MTERLRAAAIIRDGVTHSHGFKSHSEIRRKLGDEDAYKSQHSDVEGFITEWDRFVGRSEAQAIGLMSGQAIPGSSSLLSSEVMWDRVKPEDKPKTSASRHSPGKCWATPKKRF